MTKEHLYAEVLRAVAAGDKIQYKDEVGDWRDLSPRIILTRIALNDCSAVVFRVKPTAITINSYEVPEPVRKPLAKGTKYWTATIDSWKDEPVPWTWSNSEVDNSFLFKGIIHLTYKDAQLHSNALLSFTKI